MSEVRGKCEFCVRDRNCAVCNICLRNPRRYDWEPAASAKIALELEAKADRLRAELEQAQADAERYHALRELCADTDAVVLYDWHDQGCVMIEWAYHRKHPDGPLFATKDASGQTLDEAVDAIRTALNGEGGTDE